MQASNFRTILISLLGGALVSACGGPTGDTANEASEAPAMDHSSMAETPTELARTASPDGARVFFISPADGATVSNPIIVEFGISGMTVIKAGEVAENSGHHHLLIDTDLPDLGLPVPADDYHRHFGDASTSTEITLEPGQHSLQLLFADYLHIPHKPPVVSETISIIVE
jgi:hypothetical protein